MSATNIFFLLRHIGELKHLTLGQWISIVGSGITAAGISIASSPHRYDLAGGAAAGTVAVALIHILHPSPIGKVSDAIPAADSDNRVHL